MIVAYNGILLFCFAVAFLFGIFSIFLFVQKKTIASLSFLFLAGAFMRLVMMSSDPFLNLWDEQYHALVAKNMLNNSFKPMLYANPVLQYDFKQWDSNHIWLHKQPLFLWLMALSMKVAGINEWAVRLPSLFFSVLLMPILYRITSLLLNNTVAYITLFLYCFTGFFSEWLSGCFHTDHNDIVFAFFVAASLWTYFEHEQNKNFRWILLTGLFSGCAVLTKWIPGMWVYLFWILKLFFHRSSAAKIELKHLILSIGIAAIIILPWQLFTLANYTKEAVYELQYNATHFFKALEGHTGDFFYHFRQLVLLYGPLIPWLIIPGFILWYKTAKSKMDVLIIIISIVFIYIFYSLAQTKMPLFTVIAAPFMFISTAVLINKVYVKLVAFFAGRLVIVIALCSMAYFSLDFFNTIEIRHTFKDKNNWYRYSRMESANYFKKLNTVLNEKNVLYFNCKKYDEILCMFYTNSVAAYSDLPKKNVLEKLQNIGYRVAIFDNGKLGNEYLNSNFKILKDYYYIPE